eukprot:6888815-Alexandrium_andersonii.AAC.1
MDTDMDTDICCALAEYGEADPEHRKLVKLQLRVPSTNWLHTPFNCCALAGAGKGDPECQL